MKPRPTQIESARLKVGEFIGLSDRLRQAAGFLQEEARELLAEVLEAITSQERSIAEQGSGSATAIDAAIRKARQELEKAWLEADQTVEDLISQAAGELSRFTNIAESRVEAIERRLRHDLAIQDLEQHQREH